MVEQNPAKFLILLGALPKFLILLGTARKFLIPLGDARKYLKNGKARSACRAFLIYSLKLIVPGRVKLKWH